MHKIVFLKFNKTLKFYENIEEILNYRYPYEASKFVPSKKSISEVLEKNSIINLNNIVVLDPDSYFE